MAESWFTYSVKRPYPYRWFTPAVIVTGIILTVIFSLINFALTGFDLVSYAVSQPPNEPSSWWQQLTSLQTNAMQANCSPVQFPVNSQFFTNQSGLFYTLDAVWPDIEDGHNPALEGGQSPVLSYFNEPFQNCSIFLINMDIQELDRDSEQINQAPWGLVVHAFMTCSFRDLMTGRNTYVNLTTSFDAVPAGDTDGHSSAPRWLVATDPLKRASLWWGESLLSWWWATVSATMTYQQNVQVEKAPFRKCILNWYPNENSTDIMSSNFLHGAYACIIDKGDGQFNTIYHANYTQAVTYEQLYSANNDFARRYLVLPAAYRLARSMYSTVMADLGQDIDPELNALLRPESLQDFTEGINFSKEWRTGQPWWVVFQPGPATADYDALKDSTGELGITPSVISTRYSCQIPKRKSAASLVLSIFVADVVLLQVAWAAFVLIVGFFMRNRHQVNYCEGCAERQIDVPSGRSWSPLSWKGHRKATPSTEMSLLDSRASTAVGSRRSLLAPESPGIGLGILESPEYRGHSPA